MLPGVSQRAPRGPENIALGTTPSVHPDAREGRIAEATGMISARD